MTRAARRAIAALLVAFGCLAAASSAQNSPESDAYAWLQYGADGHPHLRLVPSDRAACPAATADDRGIVLTRRVEATAGFDRVLCDAALPLDARSVHAGDLALPPLPPRITRFIVLGDTGCRIKGADIQDCRDAQAWPFARIASAIARERPRPDLLVHVGDYLYRESPCPRSDARCAGSPFGDNWSTWAVDFFEPGAPLFGTAPLVFVRGNHESCRRAGLGWSRYLSPDPGAVCREHEGAAVATFDDLRFVNVDSAAGNDRDADPPVFERDERFAASLAGDRETMLVTHRPPLAYLQAHAAGDPNGAGLAAIVSGHVHLFGAFSFAGAPPALIVGTGGDTLSAAAKEIAPGVHGTVDERHGFTVFDRVPGGWSISERNPDGAEVRRCTLHARALHC